MSPAVEDQILFVLDDDNEVMRSALDSDLDEKNKRMNRELIAQHEGVATKVERGDKLTQHDRQLIRAANEIHLNDVDNLVGRHQQAALLDGWLKAQDGMTKQQAMKILEHHLDRGASTPAEVYGALHVSELQSRRRPSTIKADVCGAAARCLSRT